MSGQKSAVTARAESQTANNNDFLRSVLRWNLGAIPHEWRKSRNLHRGSEVAWFLEMSLVEQAISRQGKHVSLFGKRTSSNCPILNDF